ncbi:hypothetical protein B0H13DRAFT_1926161 [Mycena leptocephala]|nr:hypothetical protein B0H13DRAFT_1926161 [Mycena leptocephala]
MPNPKGKNGTTAQEYPADDILLEAFTKYARENSGAGLNQKDQRICLEKDFGLTVDKNKLYKLRKQVGADSVRKSKKMRGQTETAQPVMDLKEGDPAGGWGVTQVKGRLANEGSLIPRDDIRTILHDHFDEEFDQRVVGKKRCVEQHRTPLEAFGPWHQEHSDGHEKLAEQGLRISGIHLPIYVSKDQWSAYLHALLLMLNVRNGNQSCIIIWIWSKIMVANRISIQITTDQGSKVNKMHKAHEILRSKAVPEYTLPHSLMASSKAAQKIHPLRDSGDGSVTVTVTQLSKYCRLGERLLLVVGTYHPKRVGRLP